MKKYILIGSVLTTLMLLGSSCEDFLNQEPISNGSVTGFYKTEADIEQGVNGAYSSLQSYKQYGANFIYFMEVRADNTEVESITTSGGIYGDFDLFRTATTNTILDLTWAGCYEGIQRCNLVLDNIDKVQMDETLKQQYKGEMLFIRALTYFNLVRIWGDVPLVTTGVENPFDAFNFTRASSTEVYQQIVTDLTNASASLSEKVDKARTGAVTAGAANALLGKVYLTLKDYSNAEIVLKKVIESKVYKCLDTYAEVFNVLNKNSKESIFEIQYNKDVTDQGSRFANIFAPKGSTEITGGVGTTLGDNVPTKEFMKQYEVGDLRKDASIGQVSDGRSYCKKFVAAPVLPNQSDANFIVLRYADVLLMYAEALNENGYEADGDALYYLNKIRERAGLNAYTAKELSDQSLFREAVWKERRFELAFENHRWFDLVRTGKAVEAMNASGGEFTVASYQLVYPIPQSQIDAAPDKMTQNELY